MIEIIAHRGYWTEKGEQNTMRSFVQCFEKGYGIETDLRDYQGKIIISHDPYVGNMPVYFEDVLKEYSKVSTRVKLALNIKTDGIVEKVKEVLSQHKVENFFVFDASVPELIRYKNNLVPFYTRHSEYEPNPSLYPESQGVWLDQFKTMWFNQSTIEQHLKANKQVCVVSSELHRRDHSDCWKLISHFIKSDNVSLCTDFPDQAKEVLNG